MKGDEAPSVPMRDDAVEPPPTLVGNPSTPEWCNTVEGDEEKEERPPSRLSFCLQAPRGARLEVRRVEEQVSTGNVEALLFMKGGEEEERTLLERGLQKVRDLEEGGQQQEEEDDTATAVPQHHDGAGPCSRKSAD